MVADVEKEEWDSEVSTCMTTKEVIERSTVVLVPQLEEAPMREFLKEKNWFQLNIREIKQK